MMFSTRRTKILMSKHATDMRLGYDGLQKLAKKSFGQNPYQGQFFVFVNRRRTSCKVYTYDGSGDVLICKRLSRGVFCRPNPSYRKQIRITSSEFSQFFEGLNISGRILESVPNSKPTKKGLRFIPPYRRLGPANATGGINTRQDTPPSFSK
jgi:transposase